MLWIPVLLLVLWAVLVVTSLWRIEASLRQIREQTAPFQRLWEELERRQRSSPSRDGGA